jgi:hypothetical protein
MNNDQTNQDLTAAELEEPARPERQGKGLVKIDKSLFSTGDREKTKPAIINTEHRRPEPEPPRKVKDTEIIAAKRLELARLEFELENADRERRSLENRLEGVEHEISARTRQLTNIAAECQRVESKELREQFLLLFKRSMHGALGPLDSDNFARVGLMLANRKLLMSALQSEAKELDDQLVVLEKEAAELREKLGPDFNTETEVA